MKSFSEQNMISIWSGGGENYKQRSSNFELYRIICMMVIVAHHFVVNSGFTSEVGPLTTNPTGTNSMFLWLFGMWGKTGINCFLLITGYFMCKSQITIRKFLKLMLWIYLYRIVIYVVFLVFGYETISTIRIVKLLMPVWGFHSNFTSCFIGFWLTIPFWNILIRSMTSKQHLILIALLVGMYSILGSVPSFSITFNYITWFGVIYLIASYIRIYPSSCLENKVLWRMITIASITLSVLSVIALLYIGRGHYDFFVCDSNKLFALVVAVSSFICIKNIHIPYSKTINVIGGSTFGVLLIHANSDAMRTWLWQDVVNCVGHYNMPLLQLMVFSLGVVLSVFFFCILIDRIRIKLIEEPFFKWYDKKPRFSKLESYLS